jgi:predicted MPP superfamily phosphohydrolase
VERLPVGRLFRRLTHDRLELSRVEIRLRRGGPDLAGLTVALITDLHIGCNMGVPDLVRIFERVAEAQPDMVCLAGDLINSRDREVLALREPLARIRPPLGIYAVPGNHDHFFGLDVGLWRAFLGDLGVTVLLNQGHRVHRGGATLWVAGVDDLTEGRPDLAAALAGVGEEEPVLLLSHHPDFFFEAAAVDVDLTLAGHTHGGQVNLLGRPPLRHTRFGWWQGHFTEEMAQLYVSRGVGVTLLPIRIGAPPEIPLLRFTLPGEAR